MHFPAPMTHEHAVRVRQLMEERHLPLDFSSEEELDEADEVSGLLSSVNEDWWARTLRAEEAFKEGGPEAFLRAYGIPEEDIPDLAQGLFWCYGKHNVAE